jgi:predicted MFS family arabinose efflux permease
MANYLISGSLALVSAFVGMFLPMVSTVGPLQRPTNLLLGFVYGLGWFIGGFIGDVRSRHVETLGSIIWPIAVVLMIAYFLGRKLSDHPHRRFVIVLCCIFLLFLIVPGSWIAHTPLKYIPTYSGSLLAVY